VRPDDRVALCLQRGIELVVGLLAILKAGAGYVPLDPAYPAQRLAFLLEDCAPVAVLTEAALLDRLPAPACPVLSIDAPGFDVGPQHDPVLPALSPAHLAYVIYTSGSTGTPKGVQVEHAQLARLFSASASLFDFGAHDTWTLFHSAAFDFSVWELWGALAHGARLVIVPALCARSPEDFHALLCRERVTVLNQTPSAFRQLVAVEARRPVGQPRAHALRWVIFGGEALQPRLLAPWIERNDPAVTQLVNMYGITETTVHVTHRVISAHDLEADACSPIGRPLPDLCVHLLDAALQPVPPGVPGEMFVGGAGVARGYLNRPELDAARFLADPFRPGARLYRSGDLARRLPDGSLEYLGRNDAQVKLRGYRIELGEIQARLCECQGVHDACVIVREDAPGEQRLVAYIVPATPADPPAAAALRHTLGARLPEHMVPAAFVVIEALPLTVNGKLDRRALPAPALPALLPTDFAGPEGAAELALAHAWAEVLGLPRVGRADHFFELGGHSLLVVGLIERLRQQGWALDVRSIFGAPTLAAMAAGMRPLHAQAGVPPNLITPHCRQLNPQMLPLITLSQAEIDRVLARVPGGLANVQDLYPLAPLQQGILFHHLLQPRGDAYLLRTVLAFDGRARLDGFVAALAQVIQRHDILRTAVHWDGLAQPLQLVQRQATLALSELPPGADALPRLLAHTDPAQVRLDLTKAPLMAATVVPEDGGAGWLMSLLSHHLIDDNYTLQLLLGEVRSILDGQAHTLPAPLPYRDFIAQLRSVPEASHEEYFRERLGDILEPTAPFGVTELPGVQPRIDEHTLRLEPALAAQLRASARALGVSAAALFHAAWARVLAACTDRDDVVFGTTLSGRLQGSAGADRVMGLFINTLPLRLSLAGQNVAALVRQTHERLGELLQHEQASLALAQRCSGVAAPAPLFSTLLNYRHTRLLAGPGQPQDWPGVTLLRGEERTTLPLTVCINDLGQDFELTLQGVPGLDPQRLAGYLPRCSTSCPRTSASNSCTNSMQRTFRMT